MKADTFALAARLYIAGGQCGRCQRAAWDGGRVVACGLGDRSEGELGELARILAALLYQVAQRRGALGCVARVPIDLEAMPDAYLAKDLPKLKD